MGHDMRLNKKFQNGKTVLITGGGSGIGRELVRRFADDDYAIVVFSLVQEELDDLGKELEAKIGKESFKLYQADLSLTGAAEKVFETCQKDGLQIDILVNNAGFAIFGEHVEQSLEKLRNMVSLNIMALMELSTLFGRDMAKRGSGKILNIGSTLGIAPVPYATLYGGTKAFVNTFTVALGEELRDKGVVVSCMEPYATNTKFYETSSEKAAHDSDVTSDEFAEKTKAHDPAMVAKFAYEGLMDGKAIILPGFQFKMLSWFMRATPTRWMAANLGKTFKEF